MSTNIDQNQLGRSLQGNIREFDQNMTKYSLFIGGLNAKHDALKQYSPLTTGYTRLFMTKMPRFMELMYPNKTRQFRHLIEYGYVSVDGIQNTNLDFAQITGGYAGLSMDVATTAKDETNEITVKVYEFSGSPVREYLDLWITGIADHKTGLAHYHGALDHGIRFAQHNHTGEMFIVNTDATGRHDGVEYVAFLANMMPKTVKKDHFNYQSGTHEIVEIDVVFTCVKYESSDINDIGRALIGKYNVLRDYLDFKSGYKATGSFTKSDGSYNYGMDQFKIHAPDDGSLVELDKDRSKTDFLVDWQR